MKTHVTINGMENKNKCIFFHRWSLWKDMHEPIASEHITIRQIRECYDCGKKKARAVTYVRTVK